MRCYLLRHAEAAPRSTPGDRSDVQRPLTEAGHDQALAVAEGLKRLDVPVDAVATSALVRAAQTAAHVARAFGLERAVKELDVLHPDADPAESSLALRGLSSFQHVVLVGHEPHLSAWLAVLVTIDGTMRCVIKKGSIACVELDRVPPPPGSGTLRWFMTPKQLALIAQAK